MSKKALVTDYVHTDLIAGLESRGYYVDYNRTITLEEVAEVIADYDGVIINSKIVMDKAMIDKAPRLEWIARLGKREDNRGWELKGKTIGILGLGNTGSKLAHKLSSWELDLISYDKYKPDTSAMMPYVERVDLEDILRRADVISLHLPLTLETHHLVNEEFLQKCKSGVVILNTSRGKVIDTEALLASLESGHVKGACLDVFENEKPNTYSEAEANTYKKLFASGRLIVSPHVAGWTHESLARIASVILGKIDVKHKF